MPRHLLQRNFALNCGHQLGLLQSAWTRDTWILDAVTLPTEVLGVLPTFAAGCLSRLRGGLAESGRARAKRPSTEHDAGGEHCERLPLLAAVFMSAPVVASFGSFGSTSSQLVYSTP